MDSPFGGCSALIGLRAFCNGAAGTGFGSEREKTNWEDAGSVFSQTTAFLRRFSMGGESEGDVSRQLDYHFCLLLFPTGMPRHCSTSTVGTRTCNFKQHLQFRDGGKE